MQSITNLLGSHIKPLVLWTLVVLLWWDARLPQLGSQEAEAMAKRFRFQRSVLPSLRPAVQTLRSVNPRLENIVSWISSVGAAVALGDLDGDGLGNDVCLVDPRTDDVIVSPAPGTGERFLPFALRSDSLTYDPASMAPMGCLFSDLNEDGLMDIIVYYWGRTPIAFLQRKQTAPLSPAKFFSQELVPGGERWYTNAGLVADLDGDGHADLIFGNYFPDGSIVLGDDGHVEMQSSMSRANNGGSKPILIWKSGSAGSTPRVEYRRAKEVESVLGTGWTLAMAACDIDGELRPSLYLANDYGPDVLLRNKSTPGHLSFRKLRGKRSWMTPKSKVLGQDSFKGMGVDCTDLNGDGIPDIMVSNITDSFALEESNLVFLSTGDSKTIAAEVAPYREVGENLGLARSGWSWDVRFGDFDNDGVDEVVQATGFDSGRIDRWPELQELAMGNDLMLSNPANWPRFGPGDDLSGTRDHNRFYVRGRSGRFFDLASQVGMSDPEISRGIAVGDINGDGRLDFVVANQWGDSFLFRNLSESKNEFLGLHVLLPVLDTANTIIADGHAVVAGRAVTAYGTRVTIYLPDGRRIVKEVDGGNGHSGKSSPDIHVGLGELGLQSLHVAFDWRDRGGHIRHLDTILTPGWHSVQLASLRDDS
jgi:hypothetical protein